MSTAPVTEARQGFTFRQYIELAEYDQPWLIEPLLPVEGSAVLGGPPKSRKSYLSLQLALDLAHGRPWLGFKCRPSRVYYLQLDTPRSLWKLRLKRLLKRGVELTAEAEGRLIFGDKKNAPFPFDIRTPSHRQWLDDRIKEFKPDLTIIDTMSKAHGANEDNRTEMEHVMGLFQSTCAPSALLMVTHERKPQKDVENSGISRIRGSSAITGGVDIILNMRPANKKLGPRLEYKGRETEDGMLELTSLKNLFFEAQPEAHWPRLVELTLLEEHQSISAAGRALFARAQEIGIDRSEEACRKAIERADAD